LREPGIYLFLPENEYHADKALGSTSIKGLAIDPVEYQHDRLYGVEKEAEWLTWGTALHSRTLEGREAFEGRFKRSPRKSDYPGCLVTMDDLRAYAEEHEIKKAQTKSVLIENIRKHHASGPYAEPVIWDVLMDDFQKSLDGKTEIKPEVADQIELAAQWMQADAMLGAIMKDGTISAGISEVSVFYEDEGVRLKCRFDHVLPHALLDLKSFRAQRRERLERSVIRAIVNERYDLQAAAYRRGWGKAKELYEAGKLFIGKGELTELQRTVLDKALTRPTEQMKWIWAFVKNHGAPQALVRELSLTSFFFTTAEMEVEEAINRYRTLVQEYGIDKDWPPSNPAGIVGDQDIPAWATM
jgi:hypothetical protein